MKVLHLLTTSVDHGGVLSVIRNLSEGVAPVENTEHFLWVNERFEQVREPQLGLRTTASDPKGRAAGSIYRGVVDLLRLLRSERFDVLHSHDRRDFYIGAVVAFLTRRKLVSTFHFYSERRGWFRFLSRLPWVYPTWLTPNMVRYYGIEPVPGRDWTVPDPCSERFFRTEMRPIEQEFSAERKLKLLGVGMLIEWKGWHVLLEAMGALEEEVRACIEVEIVGKASQTEAGFAYERRLVEMLEGLDLADSVRISGFVPDVTETLLEADWFVLPSVNEPCSVALSEALACGKPAIATRSGGSLDTVIDGKTGFLFEVGDAAGLAELLDGIVRGEKRISATAEEIRDSVKNRAASEVARQFCEIYGAVAPNP